MGVAILLSRMMAGSMAISVKGGQYLASLVPLRVVYSVLKCLRPAILTGLSCGLVQKWQRRWSGGMLFGKSTWDRR